MRIVPGGSSVRSGAFVARGVVMMPPAYVNAGAYVDEGTMVDSHALVGSCAQIGKRVHLSAAAQIGGVLEPVNASPVIIEDDVLVGGNTGVYEGTIVRKRAVLAAGTILTRGTPVYDVVNGTVLTRDGGDAADYSRGRGGGAGLARGDRRLWQADGAERVHAGDREVSRREDGPVDDAGRSAAIGLRLRLVERLAGEVVEAEGEQREHHHADPVVIQRVLVAEAEELPVAAALLRRRLRPGARRRRADRRCRRRRSGRRRRGCRARFPSEASSSSAG